MSKMCKPCYGTGKILGGGFVTTRCEICNGSGKEMDVDSKAKANGAKSASRNMDNAPLPKLDKRSKEYKNAIRDIMDKSQLSKAEAEKIFDEEMDKLNAEG